MKEEGFINRGNCQKGERKIGYDNNFYIYHLIFFIYHNSILKKKFYLLYIYEINYRIICLIFILKLVGCRFFFVFDRTMKKNFFLGFFFILF